MLGNALNPFMKKKPLMVRACLPTLNLKYTHKLQITIPHLEEKKLEKFTNSKKDTQLRHIGFP